MAKIAPSILAADFAKLGSEVTDICKGGCDFIHVDIMDGAFVPNISFGSSVMKSLNGYATVPYDVHLMIENPDQYLEEFVTDNTAYITVHYEACPHICRTLSHIKEHGVKAGVSINPGTPVSCLEDVLPFVDMVLVMSVNPGFGGQKFIPETAKKVSQLNKLRKDNGYNFEIEVDGGVSDKNSGLLISCGADILVAGSAVFKHEDRAEAIMRIKKVDA
ncbi:ribulose-phosphate 3-epimerase [Mogibacterium diversum]|uniref:ribulose-phosphate 3-epimerase n=1 Tax=Mogibacterium diversum TaxID=114527 RepID=UPI0028D147B6|nr:ribulose-phosphate 3-epimerase [Mogibacterium diversum]